MRRRQSAAAWRSLRARACRSRAPRQSSRSSRARGWAETHGRGRPSAGTTMSCSTRASACNTEYKRGSRHRRRRTSFAWTRKRARRRRARAATRGFAPSPGIDRRPCPGRTARSSRRAPSSRPPARSARRKNAASRPATYPSSRTTRPRRSTAGTSGRTVSDGRWKSCPPRIYRRLRQNDPRKQIDRGAQAFVHRGEGVLVLDAHDVVVTGETQRADDALPFELVVAPADGAEQPRPLRHPAVRLGVDDAVDGDVLPIERDVLRVHVKDRVAERADRRRHVDALPEEVARIEVDAEAGPHRLAQLQRALHVVHDEAGWASSAAFTPRTARKPGRPPQYRNAFLSHCPSKNSYKFRGQRLGHPFRLRAGLG